MLIPEPSGAFKNNWGRGQNLVKRSNFKYMNKKTQKIFNNNKQTITNEKAMQIFETGIAKKFYQK